MKALKYTMFAMFFLLVHLSQAQTDSNETGLYDETFTDEASALQYLSVQNSPTESYSSQVENDVFIEQIGQNNWIKTNLNSESSNIDLYQNGNSNRIVFDITAERIEQNVVQIGDENQLVNIANNPQGIESAEIIQNGHGTDVMIYGSNSISGKMKIKVEGTGKSVLVRNF